MTGLLSTLLADAKLEYRPGEIVARSVVYRVIHDQNHVATHEVTVVRGRKFPPCNHCGNHPRFVPSKLAIHIDDDPNF
jgi:hypothetical protein